MNIYNVEAVVIKKAIDYTKEDGTTIKAYEYFDSKGGHWISTSTWRRELIKSYSEGVGEGYNYWDSRYLTVAPGERVEIDYYSSGLGEIKIKNRVYQFDIEDDKFKQTVIGEKPHTIHLSFKEKKFFLRTLEGKEYVSRQGISRKGGLSTHIFCESDKISRLLDAMRVESNARSIIGMFFNWFKDFDRNVWMQILAYADFDHNTLNGLIRYSDVYINRKGKNPSEILGISKQEIKYLKEEGGGISTYRDIRAGLDVKLLLDIRKEIDNYPGAEYIYHSDVDRFSKILNKGYDFKTLVRYLSYDIRRQQGICSFHEGCSLLYDTLRMIEDMNGAMREKYPKSLKKIHDLTNMDYNIMEDKIVNEKIIKSCKSEDYTKNVFEDKNFKIITPKNSDDLVREGKEMHHCVASYVKDVAYGLTKIYFLRDKEDEGNSFVTIEVKDDKVIQCKAKYNNYPTVPAMDFIKKWCKEKDLKFIHC